MIKNIQYKSVTQKLRGLAEDFGFEIDQQVIDDHEKLALIRWFTDTGDHPLAGKLTSQIYFNYIQYGRDYLNERHGKDLIYPFEKLVIDANNEIDIINDEIASKIVSDFHYLGYDREGFHLGKGVDNKLVALATLTPQGNILNLSRLVRIPGYKYPMSKFISEIVKWIKKNRKEYHLLQTYLNPNAGHYGTIYRGANLIPMGIDRSNKMSFLFGSYISKRQVDGCSHPYILTSIVVKTTPLPQLIYGLKL